MHMSGPKKKNREIKSKSISRNFLAEKFENCSGQKIREIFVIILLSNLVKSLGQIPPFALF